MRTRLPELVDKPDAKTNFPILFMQTLTPYLIVHFTGQLDSYGLANRGYSNVGSLADSLLGSSYGSQYTVGSHIEDRSYGFGLGRSPMSPHDVRFDNRLDNTANESQSQDNNSRNSSSNNNNNNNNNNNPQNGHDRKSQSSFPGFHSGLTGCSVRAHMSKRDIELEASGGAMEVIRILQGGEKCNV